MPLLPIDKFTELHIEPHLGGFDNGYAFAELPDYSGKNRNLTATGNKPINQVAQLNGKDVVYWDGSMTPLSNPAAFQIGCGWIVAKYSDATFATYNGLLSGITGQSILVGLTESSQFFDFGVQYYEFRTNDRIYPASFAPAPMNEYKLIFFRFWIPITVQGIKLGQQETLTSRRWSGQVAFLHLSSRSFCEADIRKHSKTIADYFALDLADVYPYQGDKDSTESLDQSVSFYDPPEGERISEVIGSPKRAFDLKFTGRRYREVQAMRAFHLAHYASARSCIFRNYNDVPPTDVVGYIDSEYELSGAINNYSYSFRFKGNSFDNPVVIPLDNDPPPNNNTLTFNNNTLTFNGETLIF